MFPTYVCTLHSVGVFARFTPWRRVRIRILAPSHTKCRLPDSHTRLWWKSGRYTYFLPMYLQCRDINQIYTIAWGAHQAIVTFWSPSTGRKRVKYTNPFGAISQRCSGLCLRVLLLCGFRGSTRKCFA